MDLEDLRLCGKCRGHFPEAAYAPSEWDNNGRWCRPCRTAYVRNWRAERGPEGKAIAVSATLRSRGVLITPLEYIALRSIDACEICGAAASGQRSGVLCIDHDHVTGRVRGALCDDCNLGLGRFHDNPDLLMRAVDYLAERGS